jgi:hypothetical protein
MKNRFNLHAVKYFVVSYDSNTDFLNWNPTQGTCFYTCMCVCACVSVSVRVCVPVCELPYSCTRSYKTFTLVTQNIYRPIILHSSVAIFSSIFGKYVPRATTDT